MAKIHSMFTTPAGAKLPLIDLKGKAYLQVSHRLVWFRELYPSGVIKTAMIEKFGEGDGIGCTFRAEIYVPDKSGVPQLIATGHKTETRKDFYDFMEKCETSSVGRALALAGIGTQFCEQDLDEGDRLADAPLGTTEAVTEARKSATSFRRKVDNGTAVATSGVVGDDI